MTVKAIYEDVLIPGEAKPDQDDPTGWKAIDELRGIVKGAPADVSETSLSTTTRKRRSTSASGWTARYSRP